MPTDHDLFAEEQQMTTMSFGEHIEDLRVHLIRALVGLFVGMTITFVPIPRGGNREAFYLGQWVLQEMQVPAQKSLNAFYAERTRVRARESQAALQELEKAPRPDSEAARALRDQAYAGPFEVRIPAAEFARALRSVLPDLKLAEPPAGRDVALKMTMRKSDWIEEVHRTSEPKSALISLAPLESFMIFFTVCIVTGLVISSPWVFYQIWAFIAAGLYRHERHYVKKFLPFSLGLFLSGVFLCFFLVLPFTLQFLLDFNVWLGIEPTLRITDWISFATILPLVFGVCFQTPLVMLLLERVGIFSVADYRSKRKFAILIMTIAAAVITPTGDPFTMLVLAIPMIALYELGILMIPRRKGVPAMVRS